MQKIGLVSSSWSQGMCLQVHASLALNYGPLEPDGEVNPGPPWRWGWLVSLHCRAKGGSTKSGYTHRNGTTCLYGLWHVLASLTQDEVLSTEDWDALDEESKRQVECYIRFHIGTSLDGMGDRAELARSAIVEQLPGYVASQYLWALGPKPGEEAWQQYGGVSFRMTNADINTVCR